MIRERKTDRVKWSTSELIVLEEAAASIEGGASIYRTVKNLNATTIPNRSWDSIRCRLNKIRRRRKSGQESKSEEQGTTQ